MPEDEKDDDVTVEDGEEAKGGDDLITLINASDFEGEEEGKDKGKPKEKKDEEEPEKPDKAKPPEKKKPDGDPEKADLLRKNKDLNIALHNLRQEVKSLKTEKKGDKDDPETVLSDTQLEALMTEYKDDPKTLLNIIKYQAERAAKGAAKKTVDDADVVKRKKETEDYVYQNYPDLTKDDSELRTSVNKTKETLGLEDHPYGELLGTSVTALMSLPTLLKNAYDKGRKDVEDGVKEKTRKDLIKDGDLTPKGKKGGTTDKSFSSGQDEVAKRLNMTPKQRELFKKLTGSKGSRAISVED